MFGITGRNQCCITESTIKGDPLIHFVQKVIIYNNDLFKFLLLYSGRMGVEKDKSKYALSLSLI